MAKRYLLIALLVFLVWQALAPHARRSVNAPGVAANGTAGVAGHASTDRHVDDASSNASADASLPSEAQSTLRLIASNGPFPYERDGIVFGNYEHRLPEHERGYYHEYTVPTPGAHDRGARRIIVGGDPPAVYYYSDDHYQTFRQIGAPP